MLLFFMPLFFMIDFFYNRFFSWSLFFMIDFFSIISIIFFQKFNNLVIYDDILINFIGNYTRFFYDRFFLWPFFLRWLPIYRASDTMGDSCAMVGLEKQQYYLYITFTLLYQAWSTYFSSNLFWSNLFSFYLFSSNPFRPILTYPNLT